MDETIEISKERVFNAVHSTMKRWGFKTRFTLHNETGQDLHVNVLVRDADGRPLKKGTDIGRLPNNDVLFFEADELLERLGVPDDPRDHVFNFYLIPDKYWDASDPLRIPRSELGALMKAQDHYVEHYDPRTYFSSGVLYQTPPMNDPLLAPRSSFLQQAPKVFLTEQRNTCLQVMFWSTDPSFNQAATIQFRLRKPDGATVLEWQETLPGHGVRYVDVKDALRRNGIDWKKAVDAHGFLFLEGVCDKFAFVPITVNINEVLRTFDMEHSLPPTYYGSKVVGPRKGEIIGAAARSFSGPRPVPVAPRRQT